MASVADYVVISDESVDVDVVLASFIFNCIVATSVQYIACVLQPCTYHHCVLCTIFSSTTNALLVYYSHISLLNITLRNITVCSYVVLLFLLPRMPVTFCKPCAYSTTAYTHANKLTMFITSAPSSIWTSQWQNWELGISTSFKMAKCSLTCSMTLG